MTEERCTQKFAKEKGNHCLSWIDQATKIGV